MSKKEVAKFFAGVAANQVLTHGVFALSGVEFTLFGVISFTRGLNTAAAIVWAIVLVLLVYYAWIQKGQ
ncbi:MAG TPA: hypothetical protein PLP21_16885 [Pyrinomonadaceae bacterium]|jgi:Cu/Ag efflux pump CusA|nr:hypothetical protein [Acidobacteriota bacterium]HQZ97999.1 hypothetical protein [Pyrinomonadaceae bacterium]